MYHQFLLSLGFSIFIAGILGLVRLKKIHRIYYPFLLCIWLACINEILSFILIKYHHNTIVNNNIYVLVESLLIIWLFKNTGLFRKSKVLFYVMILLLPAVWLIDNFFIAGAAALDNYFRIFYSFVIVLMSIATLNRLVVTNRKNLLKDATFLLCIGFILYFTYKILVHAFWIYGLTTSQAFILKVYTLLLYIDCITNLLYALAILWMPKKLAFTLPF